AIVPLFTLAPTELDFGDQAVGGTSAAQLVTLTNTGTVVLPISSIGTTTSMFGVSHTCGTSVAVDASCAISVVFKPTSGGAKTATLRVTGGNGAGVETVALSGTGIVPLYTLAPTALAFGDQAVGGTSAAQVVTLTNTGTVVLPISSIGTTTSIFGVSHTCGSSVAVGASCTISVVFKPTSAGAKTGYVNVVGGNGAGTKTVALSGAGIVPLYTLAPTALAFGDQAVGGTSAAQVVTLTNAGTVMLPISSIGTTTSMFGVSHTCGTSVAVGASCTISVVFKPTSAGAKTGYLSVAGGNGAGTKTVALSGTGL
ncbi:MAG TPA: choice-of-anchor D domain-containing protein, partial [Mycobacterium sp.]|nr:choice-of-anchor D domain-containing protein [Mycobacterium sp.]